MPTIPCCGWRDEDCPQRLFAKLLAMPDSDVMQVIALATASDTLALPNDA